jgi:hypothetical protein
MTTSDATSAAADETTSAMLTWRRKGSCQTSKEPIEASA